MKPVLLVLSHLLAGGCGFALGIYVLPILTAPEGPTTAELRGHMGRYSGTFKRDLQDSDALHWGEGRVAVSPERVTLLGELAPGPDYKLYLSPEFVETEAGFNRLKPRMVRVGDIKTFKNFAVPVPSGVDIEQHNTVVVWCESFGQFITAARYR
jgi:Electron transfer DM13